MWNPTTSMDRWWGKWIVVKQDIGKLGLHVGDFFSLVSSSRSSKNSIMTSRQVKRLCRLVVKVVCNTCMSFKVLITQSITKMRTNKHTALTLGTMKEDVYILALQWEAHFHLQQWFLIFFFSFSWTVGPLSCMRTTVGPLIKNKATNRTQIMLLLLLHFKK